MDADRAARLALSRVCEPGGWPVYEAVAQHGPAAVWAALRAGRPIGRISVATATGAQLRARRYDGAHELRRLDQVGGRFVVPGDEEWPADRLDWCDLAESPPLSLFVRGSASLADAVARSVAVVGSRATTVYGSHVAGELGLSLADRGWTVVSGAAYGVDGAAHRGALQSSTAGTVAVLACSVELSYPRGHHDLLGRIAETGVLVSEHPPGCAPLRSRFLVRNRLIAALSVGTVVVEAALRSGSLITARQARDIGRHLMAVPGPITSPMSAGSHRLLRNGAVCVTSAAEVLDTVGALTDDACAEPQGPVSPRDGLADPARQVLDAVPLRSWAGPASIARTAGLPTLLVQQTLPTLAVHGLVEQGLAGWRLTPLGVSGPDRAPS